ncbi:MAG: hypothetical protein HYY93_09650 [Planctomycetes bacterium]|nr:hypothetical protein [Planctomycetota bacterium]
MPLAHRLFVSADSSPSGRSRRHPGVVRAVLAAGLIGFVCLTHRLPSDSPTSAPKSTTSRTRPAPRPVPTPELDAAMATLGLKSEVDGSSIQHDPQRAAFVYDSPAAVSGAAFEATLSDARPALTVRRKDSAFGVTLEGVGLPSEPASRRDGVVLYPMAGGRLSAVYRPTSTGVKEDILVTHPLALGLAPLDWRLSLPPELEARLETDGSIGIYGPDRYLSGDIQIGDEKSRALIENARRNAPRTRLLYRLPAPIVTDAAGVVYRDVARFELEPVRSALVRARGVEESDDGGLPTRDGRELQEQQQKQQQCALTGRTTNDPSVSVNPKPETRNSRLLRVVVSPSVARLAYPISIDPSVVITTSADFMAGNNEGLVTTGGNQLTREKLTSGRLVSWGATTAFTSARTDHAAVAYNGYMYIIGGYIGGTESTDVQVAPIAGAGGVGPWSAGTALTLARGECAAVAYNGYLYVTGGYDGAAYTSTVYYAPLNPADGTIGAWNTTTAFTGVRGSHGAAAWNGRLYVIGGRDAFPLADVQYADFKADGTLGAWTAGAALPNERTRFGCAVNNGFTRPSL